LLSACSQQPEEDTDLALSAQSRVLLGTICLAYDDIRGQLPDSAIEPDMKEVHRQANEACDAVTAADPTL
jgi:hypothetical protein